MADDSIIIMGGSNGDANLNDIISLDTKTQAVTKLVENQDEMDSQKKFSFFAPRNTVAFMAAEDTVVGVVQDGDDHHVISWKRGTGQVTCLRNLGD